MGGCWSVLEYARRVLGVCWEDAWRVLGTCWSVLERVGSMLERAGSMLEHIVGTLGHAGSVLERARSMLKHAWRLLGTCWSVLGAWWGMLCACWELVGACRKYFGACFWACLERARSMLGHVGSVLGAWWSVLGAWWSMLWACCGCMLGACWNAVKAFNHEFARSGRRSRATICGASREGWIGRECLRGVNHSTRKAPTRVELYTTKLVGGCSQGNSRHTAPGGRYVMQGWYSGLVFRGGIQGW